MFPRLWNLSSKTHDFLLEHAPTNRLLRVLIARGGLRWSLVTLLIGVAYMAAGVGCVLLVYAGWNPALYLVFLLFFVNSIKFTFIGVLMLGTVAHLRVYEHRLNKHARRAAARSQDSDRLRVNMH